MPCPYVTRLTIGIIIGWPVHLGQRFPLGQRMRCPYDAIGRKIMDDLDGLF